MAKMLELCKITLDIAYQLWYNNTMNKIEQTTLSIQDIREHHRFLEQQFSSRLSIDWKQTVMDEMLERFCNTFLGD